MMDNKITDELRIHELVQYISTILSNLPDSFREMGDRLSIDPEVLKAAEQSLLAEIADLQEKTTEHVEDNYGLPEARELRSRMEAQARRVAESQSMLTAVQDLHEKRLIELQGYQNMDDSDLTKPMMIAELTTSVSSASQRVSVAQDELEKNQSALVALQQQLEKYQHRINSNDLEIDRKALQLHEARLAIIQKQIQNQTNEVSVSGELSELSEKIKRGEASEEEIYVRLANLLTAIAPVPGVSEEEYKVQITRALNAATAEFAKIESDLAVTRSYDNTNELKGRLNEIDHKIREAKFYLGKDQIRLNDYNGMIRTCRDHIATNNETIHKLQMNVQLWQSLLAKPRITKEMQQKLQLSIEKAQRQIKNLNRSSVAENKLIENYEDSKKTVQEAMVGRKAELDFQLEERAIAETEFKSGSKQDEATKVEDQIRRTQLEEEIRSLKIMDGLYNKTNTVSLIYDLCQNVRGYLVAVPDQEIGKNLILQTFNNPEKPNINSLTSAAGVLQKQIYPDGNTPVFTPEEEELIAGMPKQEVYHPEEPEYSEEYGEEYDNRPIAFEIDPLVNGNKAFVTFEEPKKKSLIGIVLKAIKERQKEITALFLTATIMGTTFTGCVGNDVKNQDSVVTPPLAPAQVQTQQNKNQKPFQRQDGYLGHTLHIKGPENKKIFTGEEIATPPTVEEPEEPEIETGKKDTNNKGNGSGNKGNSGTNENKKPDAGVDEEKKEPVVPVVPPTPEVVPPKKPEYTIPPKKLTPADRPQKPSHDWDDDDYDDDYDNDYDDPYYPPVTPPVVPPIDPPVTSAESKAPIYTRGDSETSRINMYTKDGVPFQVYVDQSGNLVVTGADHSQISDAGFRVESETVTLPDGKQITRDNVYYNSDYDKYAEQAKAALANVEQDPNIDAGMGVDSSVDSTLTPNQPTEDILEDTTATLPDGAQLESPGNNGESLTDGTVADQTTNTETVENTDQTLPDETTTGQSTEEVLEDTTATLPDGAQLESLEATDQVEEAIPNNSVEQTGAFIPEITEVKDQTVAEAVPSESAPIIDIQTNIDALNGMKDAVLQTGTTDNYSYVDGNTPTVDYSTNLEGGLGRAK